MGAEWNRATPYDLRSMGSSAIKEGLAHEPMEPLYDILRRYPELALFLTLAVGFSIGRLKIGGCSLGSVTGVLLTGLVIGQLDIPISPAIKSVFFLFFLFAVGYGVGPQFFRGLKSEGIKQALFATLVCVACLGTAYLTARPFAFGSRLRHGSLWRRLHGLLCPRRCHGRDPAAGRFARDTPDRDQRHVDRVRNHLHFWNGRSFGFPGNHWTKNPGSQPGRRMQGFRIGDGRQTNRIPLSIRPTIRSACALIE